MREIQPIIISFANGLRLAYLHTDSLVSHLGITVLAGSRFETPEQEGLAHFLEHCIFKGTKHRKAFHVLSRLDSVGGELNAYTSKEEMVLYASFTNNHLTRAMDLLADITQNSSFPEREIEKEKEIVLDEINSYLDSPGEKIFDDFEGLLFQNHSLGYNILGTKESVASFTKKDLEAFMKKHYVTENTVISYVGNASIDRLTKLIDRYFSSFPTGNGGVELEPFQGSYRFNRVEKEANYQVHSVLGTYAPSYEHDHRKGMMLLTNILGGPALNSRLNMSIREKYGYSYTIEANYTPYKDVGFWNIYFGTDPKYTKKCLKLIDKELNLLIDKPLSERQLHMAKEQYLGHLALGLESNSGLMMSLGKSVLYFNQIDTLEDIRNSIKAISAHEIQEIAEKYFKPSQVSGLTFELEG